MNFDVRLFEKIYGIPVPDLLSQYYELKCVSNGGPIRFEFHDKPFVHEIQYHVSVKERTIKKCVSNCGSIRFEFHDKPFVREIQYHVSVKERTIDEVNDNLLHFAVTTDGWELFLDLSGRELPLWQLELNDLDSLDITLNDLLRATVVPL